MDISIPADSVTVRNNVIATRPANEPENTVAFTVDFKDPVSYVYDPTISQQSGVVGIIRSMFIDNRSNPKPVIVSIETTRQQFPVPPYSSGWYQIVANENSRIVMASEGGVTDGTRAPVLFTNTEKEPVVFFGFAPLVDGARVTLIGSDSFTNMGPTNPLSMGGTYNGSSVPIRVDANGRVEVVGAAAGGVAYGPDAPASNPTQAPVQLGAVDPGNLIRRLVSTVAGFLRVDVASSVLPTGAATEATLVTRALETTQADILTRANLLGLETTQQSILTAINLRLTEVTGAAIETAIDATNALLAKPNAGTATGPAIAAGLFTVLVANAARKGGTVYVEGGAFKLRLGTPASATLYTTDLADGDYYEIPAGYTGVITGFGAVAAGTARVTELT